MESAGARQFGDEADRERDEFGTKGLLEMLVRRRDWGAPPPLDGELLPHGPVVVLGSEAGDANGA